LVQDCNQQQKGAGLTPTRGYILSAGFLAVMAALPVGYALLALNINPWVGVAASLTLAAVLTAWSSVAKPMRLLQLNWLVLLLVPTAIYLGCLAVDFNSVGEFTVWLVAILLPFALFESVTGNAIIRNLFRAIAGGGPMGYGEQRLGLTRAFASFEHPILYGVFCATNFSLVFYALRDASWQRGLRAIVIVAATFFALSSAPLLALVIQILLISWDFTTRRMPYHWIALTSMIAAAYIAVDIVSTRSPILVFVSRLTFNAETGYFRTYIWNYGIANVWQNPLFGIGENDWVRPEWMPPSVDNFWLLTAMRYGIPAFIFLILAIALTLYSLSRLRLTSPANADVRKGLMITFFALMLAGATVHFWNATFCIMIFLVGSGYGVGAKSLSARVPPNLRSSYE